MTAHRTRTLRATATREANSRNTSAGLVDGWSAISPPLYVGDRAAQTASRRTGRSLPLSEVEIHPTYLHMRAIGRTHSVTNSVQNRPGPSLARRWTSRALTRNSFAISELGSPCMNRSAAFSGSPRGTPSARPTDRGPARISWQVAYREHQAASAATTESSSVPAETLANP